MQNVDIHAIANCRSQVHTDSLTVTFDLSLTSRRVSSAIRQCLAIPLNPGGAFLPTQQPDAFQSNARKVYQDLLNEDVQSAFEFATLLSAFLHECRHVHDMRSTRIGAELLLKDLYVYSGVGTILGRLLEWSRGLGNGSIPLPVASSLHSFDGEFSDIRTFFTTSTSIRNCVHKTWNAPSRWPTMPGHSILSFSETLGFSVQIDWLAETLGTEIAGIVVDATLGKQGWTSDYVRPVAVWSTLSQAKGVKFAPEATDLSFITVNALNVSGLDDAFSDGIPTKSHPGTWFGLFCEQYVRLTGAKGVTDSTKAPLAVFATLKEKSLELGPVVDLGIETIRSLQNKALNDLAGNLDPARIPESILLASEVGTDYAEMQNVVYNDKPLYHCALGYVELLLSGALTSVFVRVRNEDGVQGAFRTPSGIPANHVGGSLAASKASQQMRILLNGRSRSGGTFFEEATFKEFNDMGLLFRRVE